MYRQSYMNSHGGSALLRILAPALAVIAAACSLPRAATTHLAWTFRQNLIVVGAVAGGVDGEFIVGTAHPATILDPEFAGRAGDRGRMPVNLGGRFTADARPVRAELDGLADGILGLDVWGRRSVTIDYRRNLIILGRDLEPMNEGLRHAFEHIPAVPILIDGVERLALVDTANPDTIQLPATDFGEEGRRSVDLQVGDVRFRGIGATVAPVTEIRLGNRVLSHFLVTIDYPRGEVTLWPY